MTAARWALPSGLGAAVVAATLVVPAVAASAGVDLPDRTAEQLLTDLQGADVAALQGTVVLDADLGLPSLPQSGGGPYGSGDLTSMLDGTTTMRVWASQDGARVAVLGTLGETDVVTDGDQVWIWSSDDNAVTHLVPPTEAELAEAYQQWRAEHPDEQWQHSDRLPGDKGDALDDAAAADARAAMASLTPEELSARLVAALEPTTEVTSGPSTRVAGRPAYQLVLTPSTPGTLVGPVTIAIDAAERVATRVTISSTATGAPAVTVGYTEVSFTAPDPSVFTFTPPAGATVEEPDLLAIEPGTESAEPPSVERGDAEAPQVVGEGWASVLVLAAGLPDALGALGAGEVGTGEVGTGEDSGEDSGTLDLLLAAMPEVSGEWGSGRLLSTHLLTVLVTDDGRTLVGAVDRATLEAAASATR